MRYRVLVELPETFLTHRSRVFSLLACLMPSPSSSQVTEAKTRATTYISVLRPPQRALSRAGLNLVAVLIRTLLTSFRLFLAERTIHWSSVARALSMKKELCRYGNDNEKRYVAKRLCSVEVIPFTRLTTHDQVCVHKYCIAELT